MCVYLCCCPCVVVGMHLLGCHTTGVCSLFTQDVPCNSAEEVHPNQWCGSLKVSHFTSHLLLRRACVFCSRHHRHIYVPPCHKVNIRNYVCGIAPSRLSWWRRKRSPDKGKSLHILTRVNCLDFRYVNWPHRGRIVVSGARRPQRQHLPLQGVCEGATPPIPAR